jgi:hypothetical protein
MKLKMKMKNAAKEEDIEDIMRYNRACSCAQRVVRVRSSVVVSILPSSLLAECVVVVVLFSTFSTGAFLFPFHLSTDRALLHRPFPACRPPLFLLISTYATS